MTYLTSEAKSKLSSTVRSLRSRLLGDLHNEVERTYLLAIASGKVRLREAERVRRRRLETWLDVQMRGEKGDQTIVRRRHLDEAVKLAAATLLNRLVVIKQMEAIGLIKPKVVTGGWTSPGYREWREFAPELCRGGGDEGMGALLDLLYDELAIELPGLFGTVGVTGLIPVPSGTLRAVIEALDAPELSSAWLDDTTLGWVYQYWNDPEREALDAKLNGGGKVEPHEIASKTQMFTERYMVEWLLHNSLGQQWLGICDRNSWIPEAQSDGTLGRLEERRSEWRSRRELGEVALDALMPIESGMEERWKYWVRQPLIENEGLSSICDIKILDPACGSGHFLVIAIGLLFAMYQEEANHRGEDWDDRFIVESILENNLYGVDIDPRAVQIAAAALVLKAKGLCRDASPRRLNLVAANLQIAALAIDDPALVELRSGITQATGIPEELTNQIVQALKGADYWGSLLKIDREVDRAIAEYERSLKVPVQRDLFAGDQSVEGAMVQELEQPSRKDLLLEVLERFLSLRTSGDDLGLRLRGEQLAAGVRFIRIIREGMYDLVIGNPPYQSAGDMAEDYYLKKNYVKGKADLYAAFLERGLQLVKPEGLSALLTMRNWMFIKQYSQLREHLIDKSDLRLIGDLETGAFEEISGHIVSVSMSVFQRGEPSRHSSIALQPTPGDLKSEGNTDRKRSAVLAQVGRFEFRSDRFRAIKQQPIVYWWDQEFCDRYSETPKIEDVYPTSNGMNTSSNPRFIRFHYEVKRSRVYIDKYVKSLPNFREEYWSPYIMGASGKQWFEPLLQVLNWKFKGLEIFLKNEGASGGRIVGEQYYFLPGAAYSTIGSTFSARVKRFASIFDVSGSSVVLKDPINVTCLMNSKIGRNILSALNPTVNFQLGDVKRLPLFPIESADEIFAQLDQSFTQHEAARETSVEFRQPGPTHWTATQSWAQQSVDRPAGQPLPPYNPTAYTQVKIEPTSIQ